MIDRKSLDAFADRLDAFGPDIDRWPLAAAGEARELLTISAKARALHRQAGLLGSLVAEAASAEPPNGFAFRVVARVDARRSDGFAWLRGSPGRLGMAGVSFCAAALAMGVVLGTLGGSAQAGDGGLDLGAAFDVSALDGDL